MAASKKELTKIFLEAAELPSDDKSVEEHWKLWWYSPHSKHGYRLSPIGHVFLSQALQLESHEFTLRKDLPRSLRTMMDTSKYITSPFYQYRNSIYIYGEADATMLALLDGDLQQFLTNSTIADQS